MHADSFLSPGDLVGCRYRLVQKQRFPLIPATSASINRRHRLDTAKETASALIPNHPRLGDNRHFRRIDIDPSKDPDSAYLDTLDALAREANIITGAVLEEGAFRLFIDALVRRVDGTYYPVIISNHRVARPDPHKKVKVVATGRLGLGKSSWAHYKLKSHAIDSYTLALAARALEGLGVGSHRGGLIGQDPTLVFLLDTDKFQQGLDQALALPTPTHPKRIKECSGCRFWPDCEQELRDHDDLSLFLSGDKGEKYREQGITTVAGLIDANVGKPSALAAAWRAGTPVLRTVEQTEIPRFDIEIDIDVEAYLDQCAYLWGAFDGCDYLPFVAWDAQDTEREGQNFAQFWEWLMSRRDAAAAEGSSFGVFCYSAHGENHWLRFSAQRFFGVIPGVPSLEDIDAFISSESWVDVFAYVKRQLVGTEGLSLKQVAPIAGFHWDADDVDGEESVNLFREAAGFEPGVDQATMAEARATLLSYNGDDCRATRSVREWLDAGAPGTPRL